MRTTQPRSDYARINAAQDTIECSHAMHAGLADMYTADERFKAHYDTRPEGLAEYVASAIKANAARQG
jgi:MerR family transcriptional regulator, thiopeptide resistance regulator